jgi:hypothetical protein
MLDIAERATRAIEHVIQLREHQQVVGYLEDAQNTSMSNLYFHFIYHCSIV